MFLKVCGTFKISRTFVGFKEMPLDEKMKLNPSWNQGFTFPPDLQENRQLH